MCEIGEEVGSFTAGFHANNCATGYMQEMVESELGQSVMQELNLEIYKLHASENG
jgi:hypothetical protein